MNIVLFEESDLGRPLPRTDRRMVHLLDVLRRQPGDATDVGLINGPRGKAILKSVQKDHVVLDFEWGQEPEPLLPIELIVGLSRPQTSRKILQEVTSLGVRRIQFVLTDRGERSYRMSKLWTTGEWRQCVHAGVEQAFSTRFPDVEFGLTLAESIQSSQGNPLRVCLDNYEAPFGLAATTNSNRGAVVLAIGSERGWSSDERDQFRQNGFTLAHLGERPLRTETAAIAAISVVSAGLLSH